MDKTTVGHTNNAEHGIFFLYFSALNKFRLIINIFASSSSILNLWGVFFPLSCCCAFWDFSVIYEVMSIMITVVMDNS